MRGRSERLGLAVSLLLVGLVTALVVGLSPTAAQAQTCYQPFFYSSNTSTVNDCTRLNSLESGSVHGESRCASCYWACRRDGGWPASYLGPTGRARTCGYWDY